jgi:hypothetical protein
LLLAVVSKEESMKEVLQAVHPKDTEDFLRRLGVLEGIQSGLVRCAICGEALSVASFRAVTRRAGVLLFACSKPACITSLAVTPKEI